MRPSGRCRPIRGHGPNIAASSRPGKRQLSATAYRPKTKAGSPMSASPARGEVWMADLDPTVGHEQGRRRPVLIVSHDRLNRGPAGLVVAVPITGTARGIATHVPVTPPE